VILLYGNRDWDSITFREEIEDLQTRVNLSVVHVLAEPPPDWTGERGRLTAGVFQRYVPAPLAAHEYFICGPGPMMDAAETLLASLGVPVSKYHAERYSFA
jgi:ferredoxin-NADP reductase